MPDYPGALHWRFPARPEDIPPNPPQVADSPRSADDGRVLNNNLASRSLFELASMQDNKRRMSTGYIPLQARERTRAARAWCPNGADLGRCRPRVPRRWRGAQGGGRSLCHLIGAEEKVQEVDAAAAELPVRVPVPRPVGQAECVQAAAERHGVGLRGRVHTIVAAR